MQPDLRDIPRWYLMIYPDCRKGLVEGIEREIARRKRFGETPIEYFAPTYVEAHEVGNRIVNTEKPLFYNYLFVRASENELFRMKQFEPQYNFPRRERDHDGKYHYPYVSDQTIRDLQWIARSYAGSIPVLTDDPTWLIKGDRIKITQGQFKGVEANIFENCHTNDNEIIVVVDRCMSVPLLHVKAGQYKVIGLSTCNNHNSRHININDTILAQLHNALCRTHTGATTDDDHSLANRMIAEYADVQADSDVMRCKQYSILLMAMTIIGDIDRRSSLLNLAQLMIPSIRAEQALAQLLVTLYGCTDNSFFRDKAIEITSPWALEHSPKRSKQTLLTRLKDYDQVLEHRANS